MSTETAPPREHVHVWIHVGTDTNRLVCKCVCGERLTPSQIVAAREEAGVR